MEYKPHDYQQFAINYILEHPIAAVILGMGLGKTSITLTAIEQLIYDSFEVSKVLVVAPLRVARNTWSDEIHKWNHLKHLRYSIVLGSAAERKKALEADADIYIINRENLQWLIEQSGVNFFWDMVVLDELSSFKNWNSKRFKAFMKVRPKVKRVIGLANAIILSAVADYRAALKKVKRNPKSKSAIDEALQIEKFFRSSWYQQLTSVAGEFLIRKLQDEIRQSE